MNNCSCISRLEYTRDPTKRKMNDRLLMSQVIMYFNDKFLNSFFNIYFFWERERERENKWGRGRDREEDTESEAGSRLWAASTEPDMGLKPMNLEIMTWAKVSCLTDQVTQAPPNDKFFTFIQHFLFYKAPFVHYFIQVSQ